MSKKPTVEVQVVNVTCPEEKDSLHWQKNKKFEVFCTVEVQREKKKTKKVASTQTTLDPPPWNEKNAKKIDVLGASAEVLVYHKERLLGQIQIDFSKIADNSPLDSTYELQTRKSAGLRVIVTRQGLDSILKPTSSTSTSSNQKQTPSSLSSSNLQSQVDLSQYKDLPEGWKAAVDKKGKVYFFNKTTKTTSYTDPRTLIETLRSSQTPSSSLTSPNQNTPTQSPSFDQNIPIPDFSANQTPNQNISPSNENSSSQTAPLNQNQGPTCSSCQKEIVQQGLNALGKIWHRQCFNCDFCHKSLLSEQFSSNYERPFCGSCRAILFGDYCAKCQKLITIQAIKSANGLFHPECA